jgi:ZIP family zinc transporter
LATFLAALEDPSLGVAIAVAVALHNIPEGISVSVPIFYATGNRKRAFVYSLLSGLSEPIGAAVAYIALLFLVGDESGVIPPQIMGALFGGVAGIMVYISLDELLPASRAYGKGHDSLLGLIAGMAVMAASLLLMN